MKSDSTPAPDPCSTPGIIKVTIVKSDSTPASDPCSTAGTLKQTPVTSFGSKLKRRLSFFDIPAIETNPKTKFLSQLQASHFIPNCLYSLEYLLTCDITNDKGCLSAVDKFPKCFGKYIELNLIKSFSRLQNDIKSISSDNRLISAAFSAYESESLKKSHHELAGFNTDSVCSICFPKTMVHNATVDDLSDVFRDNLEKFYSTLESYGSELCEENSNRLE